MTFSKTSPFARCVRAAAGIALGAIGVGATHPSFSAESYPSRPVRLIVPYAAGGNADIVGRIVAEGLTKRLGQQVVVDNRSGAASIIGTQLAANAPADGYTLLLVANTFAVNPSLAPKLPYDTLKDLVPISLVGQTPQVLVVTPSLPVNSVKEFIAYAKSKPNVLNYGSTGIGSTANMAGALLNSMAGIQLVHVPYKGTAQSLIDVIAGHLHVAIPSMTSSIAHIRAGKIKALGLTSSKRSAQLPDVPTVAEAGVPGYQAVIWNGVLAPAGTPKPVLDRLSRELAAAMRSPEASARYGSMGAETIGSTPEEFARFLRSEIEQYAQVIKEAGLKAELAR
ncbi:MAG: tripartite tricarboxylate transporter substrate binding protein [Betaproteobacteria bacterium]|nr:tripartite tricarboxylate transporter substrate binding protein [Betaproteobacteria bacterium]